jgi:hypothetical protein
VNVEIDNVGPECIVHFAHLFSRDESTGDVNDDVKTPAEFSCGFGNEAVDLFDARSIHLSEDGFATEAANGTSGLLSFGGTCTIREGDICAAVRKFNTHSAADIASTSGDERSLPNEANHECFLSNSY